MNEYNIVWTFENTIRWSVIRSYNYGNALYILHSEVAHKDASVMFAWRDGLHPSIEDFGKYEEVFDQTYIDTSIKALKAGLKIREVEAEYVNRQ